jgi:hypothetical protein
MRRDSLLPDEQLSLVVSALYADADARSWQTLSLSDRTRIYSSWVEDENVGGILTKYMSSEAARSWIKDGPMKEYNRATRGTGRYARFGRKGGTGPIDIAFRVLGAEASVVDDTVGVKPSHCRAVTDAGDIAFLTWGVASNFRNLVWAALRASVEHGYDSHVIVMEPPGRATTTDEVLMQKALAERCGVGLHHMRERLGTRPPGSAS